MSWDKFKHKLLCAVSPKYKQERVKATKDLVSSLESSQLMILKKIEDDIKTAESIYRYRRKACQTPEESLELDAIEERLVRTRLKLETVKSTGCKFNQLDMVDINRQVQHLLK